MFSVIGGLNLGIHYSYPSCALLIVLFESFRNLQSSLELEQGIKICRFIINIDRYECVQLKKKKKWLF